MKSKTLFAGIDWASKTHLVCVVDETGGIGPGSRSRTPARRSRGWSID